MNKKNLETIGLGTLHEFSADAVYPRKRRRLGEQTAVETLSVVSQFQEIVVRAITPKKRRKLAAELKRRPGTQRKKARATQDR